MSDKELEKEAEKFIIERYKLDKCYRVDTEETRQYMRNDVHSEYEEEYQCYLAGAKAHSVKWHKVADGDLPKGENIHRDIYLKDRYGNLYTGNYFPKDETHTEDCFAVEFIEWGFQGSQFCMKEQIAEWCELSEFYKE